jgi:hypothetical protein
MNWKLPQTADKNFQIPPFLPSLLRRNAVRVSCPPAVAENQPANKHRMNTELSRFATRLRELIFAGDGRRSLLSTAIGRANNEPFRAGSDFGNFNELALELFALQFKFNSAYRKICEARQLTPPTVGQWTQIPAVPTAAFKELELTSLAPDERVAVFHSSGTTEQKPSRHFHNAESLAVYEASLLAGFFKNVPSDCRLPVADCRLICLTPPPSQVPHSSLVHMFETVRQKLGAEKNAFVGRLAAADAWTFEAAMVAEALSSAGDAARSPMLLLGPAFSFVPLLDYLMEKRLRLQLPPGSRVMETGGYKNRSRSLPKAELHALITDRLGIPRENIVCEYGMCELSSQAYDLERRSPTRLEDGQPERAGSETGAPSRIYRFPPWSRVQIISPETGREVAEGETGLIRVMDLANVFSVAAIQTEDLGVRRGNGFELLGRAQLAEPRGCSRMAQ